MDRLGNATPEGKRYFEDLLDVDADLSALATKLLNVNAAGTKVVGASGLYWDEVNDRFGIGTPIPDSTLHVYSGNSAVNIGAGFDMVMESNSHQYFGMFSRPNSQQTITINSGGSVAHIIFEAGTRGDYLQIVPASYLYILQPVAFGALDPSAKLHVTGTVTTEPVAILQAPASLTANILEAQLSDNTVVTQIEPDGVVKAAGYKSSDGSAGWTGTFTNGDGATVTVKNGLITGVA